VSVGLSMKTLVRKRDLRGLWFYALWLATYCLLALITTIYAAVLGQDYRSLLVFLLVPAAVGCVQLRFPTLLGWVLLVVPTALAGVVASCLVPWLVKGTLATGDWSQLLVGALLLAVIGAVLYGLILYRPTVKTPIAESRPGEDCPPSS